jgi:hypothetical protein
VEFEVLDRRCALEIWPKTFIYKDFRATGRNHE